MKIHIDKINNKKSHFKNLKSESLSPQTQFKRAKSALKNTMAFEEHSYSKIIDLPLKQEKIYQYENDNTINNPQFFKNLEN